MKEQANVFSSLLRMSDMFIVTSQAISKNLQDSSGIPNNKLRVIVPPTDTAFYQPIPKQVARAALGIPQNERVILYIGNLTRQRFPQDRVLSILKGLRKEGVAFSLRVFSPPGLVNKQYASSICNQAQRLGLGNLIKVENRNLTDEEKRLVYNASDLFLFMGLDGSFAVEPPLTVLEAMSCGLPVVASSVLSVDEIIENNKHGITLPAMADADLWVKKIIDLLQSNKLDEIGSTGRMSVVSKASLSVVGLKLSLVYRELTAKN
ncbi:MAG: glycosyltransferase family 4 protein [Candidatus Bathyarchaeota archaeon]|nr:glycosyltransferase family 4 protein [Candidatus Bathyarchaeota archaeon]